MSEKDQPAMDVFPWPQGKGFAGASLWWEYVLSQDEHYRLDMLILLAHLDETIRERLVRDRDDELLVTFALSAAMCTWLKGLQIATLTELAQAILQQRNGAGSD